MKTLATKDSVFGFPLLAALPDWLRNQKQVIRALRESAITNNFLLSVYNTGPLYSVISHNRHLSLDFRLRYWAPYRRLEGEPGLPYDEGFVLQRDAIGITSLDDFGLQEHREMIGVTLTGSLRNSIYTLILFTDASVVEDHTWLPKKEDWHDSEFPPPEELIGLSHFLACVVLMFQRWETAWMGVMDLVDKNVRVQVRKLRTSFSSSPLA